MRWGKLTRIGWNQGGGYERRRVRFEIWVWDSGLGFGRAVEVLEVCGARSLGRDVWTDVAGGRISRLSPGYLPALLLRIM